MFSRQKIIGLFWLFIQLHCNSVMSAYVDPGVVLQPSFKGWGTSLAWWADVVGGMDQDVFDHVVDALFSPSKLNMNIVRYVIGGTTPNNRTCGDFRDGGASESFRDGPEEDYDWTRDPRQIKILLAAKEKGVNIFEAFSNTPPQWLTISGCSKGNPKNPPLHNNLDAANAPQFADYATEVIKHFHSNLNVTFTTYAPFNEPFGLHGIGSWVGENHNQEGCNMNRPTMVSVIQSVHESIVAKNLTFLKIAASDETQVNTQVQSYDYFTEAGVSNLFSKVNVHGYWDEVELSRKDLLSLKSAHAGQDLWMDEMGWAGSPVDNMDQGLNIANRIIIDLRKMMPSAWVYWQAVEDVGSWGLINVPFKNATVATIEANSGYYALSQFSHHIRQGSRLIYISDEHSIAAINDEEKKLVIVTVNPTQTEQTKSFDLSLFPEGTFGTPTLFRTSSVEQHVNVPPPSIDGGSLVLLETPPESVSTLEFTGIEYHDLINLISNGDFEDVETINGDVVPLAWNETSHNYGVTEDNSWRGQYSGSLRLGLASSSIVQAVQLPDNHSNCTLYLTAICSSTQLGTSIKLSLPNTDQSASQSIGSFGAYNLYSISHEVSEDDNVVLVSLENRGGVLGGTAKIDNAFLHSTCI